MNTQELAAKIAAKRKQQEETEVTAAHVDTAATVNNSKAPATKQEEIRVRLQACVDLYSCACMLIVDRLALSTTCECLIVMVLHNACSVRGLIY